MAGRQGDASLAASSDVYTRIISFRDLSQGVYTGVEKKMGCYTV